MATTQSDERVMRVFTVLQQGPTSADLGYLIEEFTYLGYLAAQAESMAEMAEAQRKHEWATSYAEVKSGEGKVTDAFAQAQADILTFDFKKAEVKAYEKARKMKNLLNSIEQAINAIKFLGRQTDAPVTIGGRIQK